jgi:Predicted periplasmic or secreted lipoprotein
MRIIKSFLALSIAILAFSFISVNAQSYEAVPGQQPATALERQVFKKVISLPRYGVFDHIAFQVNGGTVTLYGKVISLGTKRDAESVVRRIPGVTSVVNNIEELPPSPFDNQIRYSVLRQLANSAGMWPYLQGPNPQVRIIVDRGHVTLEGYVPNRGTSNTMNIITNGVSGVFSVTNNLVVGDGRS